MEYIYLNMFNNSTSNCWWWLPWDYPSVAISTYSLP